MPPGLVERRSGIAQERGTVRPHGGLESFINVQNVEQRAEFKAMAGQSHLPLLFYDETLSHRLSKVVPLSDGAMLTDILTRADGLLQRVPREQFDFDRAKAEVMARTRL